MTTDPAPCGPGPDGRHAWETGTFTWDAFYLLIFVAVLVIVLISKPASVLAVGAMGAMIAWYVLLGRPLWTGTRTLLARARPGRAWAVIYVTGIFALFGVVQSQNSSAWFLAFAFCPQFFSFASGRVAIWLGIALNFMAAALLVSGDPTRGAAIAAFSVATAGCGFSIFYSGWVTRIIQQSAERAQIIEQLEATRAELAAAQHAAGRMAERQRLAADIHDTLAQGFASILMLIQAAQADLDGSRPQAGRHLDSAERTARENLAEARALVAGLAPVQLEGGTLIDALGRLSAAAGVDASFGLTGQARPLPMAAEVVLLRVCQEALSNVRKHAHARSVTVRLSYDPGTVRLEVSDDGQGFDPAGAGAGFGLRGMRARVAEVGGTLAVDSKPGAGTKVSVAMRAEDSA